MFHFLKRKRKMQETLETVVLHKKDIIGGRLYDTEKADEILSYADFSPYGNCEVVSVLMITAKGNFFTSKKVSRYAASKENGIMKNRHEINFSEITPVSKERAMEIVGKRDLDKYREIFGEVEEA